MTLQPGDVLLYKPKGFYGRMIQFHTGFPISHVEVVISETHAIASRDGQGVNTYPIRTSELKHVLRASLPFDRDAALVWFLREGKGQPYGWLDLLQFCGYSVNGKGMVCSPCATYVLRAGGIPVFRNVPAEKITPKDFLLSELLTEITDNDVITT